MFKAKIIKQKNPRNASITQTNWVLRTSYNLITNEKKDYRKK